MTTLTASPAVLLTAPGSRVPVPAWIRKFAPKTATTAQLRALGSLPAVTVVEAPAPESVLERSAFLKLLAARHHATPEPAKVVFVFEKPTIQVKAQQLADLLAFFFDRASDVEFAAGARQASFAMEEALAKISAFLEREAPPTPPDALGQLKGALAVTADLRAPSGRLSAEKVARLFGLSTSEVAQLAGKTRQAVSKTDDADSLQPTLRPFERIARLRAALGDDGFRAWLNQPLAGLDGSPLELVRAGNAETVAELVEDLLTGSPT